MKTIVQKELREGVVLAVVGLIVFSLMLLQDCREASVALDDVVSQSYYGQIDGQVQPLLTRGFLTQVCFFCAIFGAAIGWKQIFTERHRDLRAFLIHRPSTRTEIFFGKVIAGLALYLGAIGLPLLCMVGWVQYPGHLAAPFEWRMAIPAFGFCAAGMTFYFAGMLTGLRQARWYVSRGLGLAAAAVVCVAIYVSSSLWHPLLATGAGLIVLGTAAWGAFQAEGYYEGQAKHAKVALILSLTIGSAVALIFLAGLTASLLSSSAYSWTYYSMATNGIIYKITQSRGRQAEIADLDGKPLLDDKTGRMMQMAEFNRRMSPAHSLNVDFEPQTPGAFVEPSRYFVFWGATPDTVWYFRSKYGRLVGYDFASRRVAGSMGPAGFATGAPMASDRFDLPLNHTPWTGPSLLNTRDTVYQSDLANRSVKAIFKSASDDPVGGAISLRTWEDKDENHAALVATRRLIWFVKPHGDVGWKIPFEPSYPEYSGIRFSPLHDLKQFAIWLDPSFAANQKRAFKLPTHVRWLTADGTTAKTIDLPSTQIGASMDWDWKVLLALMACNVVVGLPLAFWFCRRYAMPSHITAGWLIFLLVTGVPGLFAFLSVYDWPAKEQCPSCRKWRVVTRTKCEHCGAGFEPPPAVGIEIFEQALT
jgi:ABC-type transport system involved in multi-copper enzyme maturation permease subunit